MSLKRRGGDSGHQHCCESLEKRLQENQPFSSHSQQHKIANEVHIPWSATDSGRDGRDGVADSRGRDGVVDGIITCHCGDGKNTLDKVLVFSAHHQCTHQHVVFKVIHFVIIANINNINNISNGRLSTSSSIPDSSIIKSRQRHQWRSDWMLGSVFPFGLKHHSGKGLIGAAAGAEKQRAQQSETVLGSHARPPMRLRQGTNELFCWNSSLVVPRCSAGSVTEQLQTHVEMTGATRYMQRRIPFKVRRLQTDAHVKARRNNMHFSFPCSVMQQRPTKDTAGKVNQRGAGKTSLHLRTVVIAGSILTKMNQFFVLTRASEIEERETLLVGIDYWSFSAVVWRCTIEVCHHNVLNYSRPARSRVTFEDNIFQEISKHRIPLKHIWNSC